MEPEYKEVKMIVSKCPECDWESNPHLNKEDAKDSFMSHWGEVNGHEKSVNG